MKINDFFDKVYCLNLKSRKDRLAHIKEELEVLGVEYSLYEAIDGKTVSEKPGRPPHPSFSTISLGNLGLILSHRGIIKEAIEQNLKSVLILEDDASFSPAPRIEDFLDIIPKNWDMVYLGGNHNQPPKQIDDKVLKCSFTFTTHAVAIRDNLFQTVLKITEDLSVPIDYYYATLHKIYNTYCPVKNLSWQIESYSDIEDKHTNYKFLKNE